MYNCLKYFLSNLTYRNHHLTVYFDLLRSLFFQTEFFTQTSCQKNIIRIILCIYIVQIRIFSDHRRFLRLVFSNPFYLLLRNGYSDFRNGFYIIIVFIILKLDILRTRIIYGKEKKFQHKSCHRAKNRAQYNFYIRYICT